MKKETDMTTKLPDTAPVYEAINNVMGDVKAQLEKKGKTQFGGKAVTADDMMLEIRQAMTKHELYLHMTEVERDRVDLTKTFIDQQGITNTVPAGAKFYVVYEFTWIYKGIESKPERSSQTVHLNAATDCGSLRTYGWKYFVRTAFMIATGEEDLDAYGKFDEEGTGELQREATEQDHLNSRYNLVQTYLAELGFHNDYEKIMAWILRIGEEDYDPKSPIGLATMERWCNLTVPLVEKYGRERVVASIRSCIEHLMDVKTWIAKSKLSKPEPEKKEEPKQEPAPQEPEEPIDNEMPPEAYEEDLIEEQVEPPSKQPETIPERRVALSMWLQKCGYNTPQKKSAVINWMCSSEGLSLSKLNHEHLKSAEWIMEAIKAHPDNDKMLLEAGVSSGLSLNQWLQETPVI